MMLRSLVLAGLFLVGVHGIGQDTCVTFTAASNSFPIVTKGTAAPILMSSDDWPGVQVAAATFAADVQRVSGTLPTVSNVTSSTAANQLKTNPIIVGTLGKSSLIDTIVNNTKLDVSSIQGQWEAFIAVEVQNPLPDITSAYVIIGADKRGTIFALYDHSEQMGVSPWYWWADVPAQQHSSVFVDSTGCRHGSPNVKYRGIFLNDEQPALQNWATVMFTNGTAADLGPFGAPFNHFFYTKLFELILRMKANYLWPAMWAGMFAIDDPQNQFLADYYGVVMGTSHQEPMLRSTPNEFSYFNLGDWAYETNAAVINQYWLEGIQRAKNYESIITIGMRGFGDLPLSTTENIGLLTEIVNNQTQIIESVMGDDISAIPQMWCLYEEVEGYYDDGMSIPDYVTLLWTDDNFGNVRRYPVESERNRTGGAGVYYHVDFVGGPSDYKWITTTQIEKIYEQMSLAVDRGADRIWILNVGDLKPYERETEFFINLGWNATRWNPDNLDSYYTLWAQREFGLSAEVAAEIPDIVGNLTRWNARRKPEMLTPTTFSLTYYREAEIVLQAWENLLAASTKIYNSLSTNVQPAFFQLLQHPISASANLANIFISAGINNLYTSQARISANGYATEAQAAFAEDWTIENEYHTMLDGKWDHMMDQTHVGYYYWQQPMANTMPAVSIVQPKKMALAGVMRISPENTLGSWPGDNPNQCSQGYNCPAPVITLDNFDTFGNKYLDVGLGSPTGFTWVATSNASWLDISVTQGTVTAANPETRVFFSVKDWSQLPAGTSYAALNFTANAVGQKIPLVVPVVFEAIKNELPSSFSGFVEGAGVISIEAENVQRNTTVDGVFWKPLPRYGRTVSGITTWPHLGNNDANYTAGTGPSVQYDFYNFNTQGEAGNLTVSTMVNPSWNANGDDRPIGFAVQIDDQTPQSLYFFPVPAPGMFPAAWNGDDGFAANMIANASATFTGVSPGAHTLTVYMIEPAVVVEKIIIDAGGLLPSYLGPPQSIYVS
ncbi:hypothetical protein H0H92_014200 [Tricholoma furcatifolium]|nr:hypothetical protein H0H92_014200 [Tricholoma furcatifolium]